MFLLQTSLPEQAAFAKEPAHIIAAPITRSFNSSFASIVRCAPIIVSVLLLASTGAAIAQGQWESVGPKPDASAAVINAIDSMTCFLSQDVRNAPIGEGTLHVTRTGGRTWVKLSDSTISIDAQDARLLTRVDAARWGDEEMLRILQSTDTGRTWVEFRTIPRTMFDPAVRNKRVDVYAFDTTRVFIFRELQLQEIPRTGAHPHPSQLPVSAVECLRRDSVFWAWSQTRVLRTTDFGGTWDVCAEDERIWDLAAASDSTAWYSTLDLMLKRTDDGGATWNDVPLPHVKYYRSPTAMDMFPARSRYQFIWIRIENFTYALNDDGTWDGLDILQDSDDYRMEPRWISRCPDGTAWTAPAERTDVYRATSPPTSKQELHVKDLSSYGVKRANVILPHIGWSSWQEAVIERAPEGGAFAEVGRIRSPDYVFPDETPVTAGPFRYRVTFNPPAGTYDQLSAPPVTLDRDSTLILDLLNYLPIPGGTTLVYDNGRMDSCTYFPNAHQYLFHRWEQGADVPDASLFIAQHPDLLIYEDGMSTRRIFNDQLYQVDQWKCVAGTRFIVTDKPPLSPPDTIALTGLDYEGDIQITERFRMKRGLGIIEYNRWQYDIPNGPNMLVDHYMLADILATGDVPHVHQCTLHPPYPNPAVDEVHAEMELAASGAVQLSVHDILGRRIAAIADGRQDAGLHHFTISTSGMRPGSYFLILRSGHLTAVQPFIVR